MKSVIIGCIVFSVSCIAACIAAVVKAWREIPDMRGDD